MYIFRYNLYMSSEHVQAATTWPGPHEPHQGLPPLPPSSIETPRILKGTIAASRALAALDVACRRLPDPTLLINSMPLLEAQVSTEIENIVTTSDELFRAAFVPDITQATPEAKEALLYRTALRRGSDALRHGQPLGTDTAKIVCSVLLDADVDFRVRRGTFIGNSRTRQSIYMPPSEKVVIEEKMAAWQEFVRNPHGIDPLIATALLHYQFEAIHPFPDGNGRTGRVLNLLCLQHFSLLHVPVLYLSSHFLQHRAEYYALLLRVTSEGAWEAWVEYFLRGIEQTSVRTLGIIDAVLAAQRALKEKLLEIDRKLPAAELAELLSQRPYVRIDNVTEAGLAERQTASRWLSALVDAGILADEKVGRSRLFVNTGLLDALRSSP